MDSDKWTDTELERLEKRISQAYEEASKELGEKAQNYFLEYEDRFKKEELAMLTSSLSKEEIQDKWLELYGNASRFEGWYLTANHAYGADKETAEANFKKWEYAQLGRGQHWNDMRDQMAERLAETNKIAEGYINGVLPKVYIANNNAVADIAQASAMAEGVTGIRFDLVDEYTVRNLMTSSSDVRPYKPVNVSIDESTRWSKNKLQNALLQGILQGDSIEHIADRFQNVTNMNRSAAIRNARTSVTNAQSAGKQDRYNDLAKQGCVFTKIWKATNDERTREEHWEADGQEVDYDQTFEVGGEELMYPADPVASGWNRYNCRCTMRTGKPKFVSVLPDQVREDANIRIVGENQPKPQPKPQTVEKTIEKPVENIVETETNQSNEDATQRANELLYNVYDRHIDENNLSLVKIDESNTLIKNNIGANFGGIDAEMSNHIVNTLGTLTQEYDTSLQQIRIMDKMEYLSHTNAFAYVYHDYSVDKATLVLNPAKLANYDKYSERINELMNKHYMVNIDKDAIAEYITTHEFAHTMIDMGATISRSENWANIDIKKIEKARKDIEGIYNDYMSQYGVALQNKKDAEGKAILSLDEKDWENARIAVKELEDITISNYALVSSDEFMAECFALDRLGTGNEWSSKVVEVLDANFRR